MYLENTPGRDSCDTPQSDEGWLILFKFLFVANTFLFSKELVTSEHEIHSIVKTMKAYPKVVGLQQEICYVVRRLCYQPYGKVTINRLISNYIVECGEYSAEKNQATFAQENGITLIIELMKDYPVVEEIQMEASAALINLALNGRVNLNS